MVAWALVIPRLATADMPENVPVSSQLESGQSSLGVVFKRGLHPGFQDHDWLSTGVVFSGQHGISSWFQLGARLGGMRASNQRHYRSREYPGLGLPAEEFDTVRRQSGLGAYTTARVYMGPDPDYHFAVGLRAELGTKATWPAVYESYTYFDRHFPGDSYFGGGMTVMFQKLFPSIQTVVTAEVGGWFLVNSSTMWGREYPEAALATEWVGGQTDSWNFNPVLALRYFGRGPSPAPVLGRLGPRLWDLTLGIALVRRSGEDRGRREGL